MTDTTRDDLTMDQFFDLLLIRAKGMHLMDGTYLPDWIDDERETMRAFLVIANPSRAGSDIPTAKDANA